MHDWGHSFLSNIAGPCKMSATVAAILGPSGTKPKDQAYELKLEKIWVFDDNVTTTLNMPFRLLVTSSIWCGKSGHSVFCLHINSVFAFYIPWEVD